MNNQQRKYIVDKIKETINAKVEALKRSIPESPSINNYLFHAAMSGKLKVKSSDEVEATFKERALKSKAGKNWLTTNHAWGNDDKIVNMEHNEIFIIPEEFKRILEQYENDKRKIETEITELRIQEDTLITRITLASDRTLQSMINEVDDMGNIKLIDTKIKMLSQ